MKFSFIIPFANSHLDSKTANTRIYDVLMHGSILNEFGNTVHSIACIES